MKTTPFARVSLASVASIASLALHAPAQYTISSAPGPYLVPASGTGGHSGQWDLGLLPTGNDLIRVPLSGAGVPNGATSVNAITIYDLSHTWIGDLYFVLESPSGAKYGLVARPGYSGGNGGNSGDLVHADVTIVDPSTPGALLVPTFSNWPSGTYQQYFNSTWHFPGQLAAVASTNMSSIPIAPGVWNLVIYDYELGELGSFARWEMSGDSPPPPPIPYCTSSTSTHACVASISGLDNPSVTFANPCVLTVSNVEGQKSGIFFYGLDNNGFTPTPWSPGSSSFLCVKGPTQRMNALNSGGTLGSCDGALAQDWNAFQIANPIALGNPFSAGEHVFVQGWFRDPDAAKTTNLSNGLRMTVNP